MSVTVPAERVGAEAREMHWSKWVRQTLAVCGLELRRNAISKRSVLVYLIAALPAALTAALAAVPDVARELADPGAMLEVRANIYEGLVLRMSVFFGCAWVFMNLFRGEIVDRSLHYYFLCAVRREVVVVGKFLAGAAITIAIFSLTTLAVTFFLYLPLGSAASRHLLEGGGLQQAGSYFLMTALACVGYGALFLVIGLFFRNPIVPALVVYGWEAINFLLPPVLKRGSVIYYLHSLSPVPISEGPFALIAEPAPAWIAVPSLLLFALVLLTVAAWRIRRMEISYGSDT